MRNENIRPNYLRIHVTHRCNLACPYCHNEGMSISRREELSPAKIRHMVNVMLNIGINKIKLIGGEPTMRHDLVRIIGEIRKLSPKTDISLITNGTRILDIKDEMIAAGVSRINISIHGWHPHRYFDNTGSTLTNLFRTREAIVMLNASGYLSKVNFVLRKRKNEEELFDIIQFVAEHGIKLDVLNLLGGSFPNAVEESEKYTFLEIQELVGRMFRIELIEQFIPANSLPSTKIYLANGAVLNLKSYPLNRLRPFRACETCRFLDACTEGIFAIRLTTDGMVKPCLLRDDNCFNLGRILDRHGEQDAKHKLMGYLNEL